jgi:hypothetical protein
MRTRAVDQSTGDWNGAVMLECNQGQACRFAGRFLSKAPADAVDDVVRDVLGELANMIGGNLKSVLTREIHITMPSVVDGSDYSLRVCGAEVRDRMAFECAEGLFWVTTVRAVPRRSRLEPGVCCGSSEPQLDSVTLAEARLPPIKFMLIYARMKRVLAASGRHENLACPENPFI